MKLVIDIPEDCYRYIKELQSLIIARGTCKTIQKDVIDAIKNGTPLPEEPDKEMTERQTGKCGKCEYYRNNYGYGQCYAQKNAPRIDYNHPCENFKSKTEETEKPIGEWILERIYYDNYHMIDNNIFYCSMCGRHVTTTASKATVAVVYPFCYGCGTKMEEKSE